ncbi:hypothetical protein OIU74_003678 [Salix koriyanagi]|uniref:Uncharacterized protein n=1 Tax=Salix koriyanagi TaxID=2511006 RepID=A0A9Q0UYB9_9ROSI|nr:hypothetical protein OIU74_003678 [Salix koriyanagi]
MSGEGNLIRRSWIERLKMKPSNLILEHTFVGLQQTQLGFYLLIIHGCFHGLPLHLLPTPAIQPCLYPSTKIA